MGFIWELYFYIFTFALLWMNKIYLDNASTMNNLDIDEIMKCPHVPNL